MKRTAFTMIELVFVIVVLGILAAVAIPKLVSTKDDADSIKEVTNLKTAILEIHSNLLMGRTYSSIQHAPVSCFTFVNNDQNKTVTITTISPYRYCEKAHLDANTSGLLQSFSY